MSQERHTVRVTIYGTEYPIQADADSAYIQKIAQYVDTRMHEIPSGSTALSIMGVAILAALNIADELHREREERQHALAELNDNIETLIRRLEQVL